MTPLEPTDPAGRARPGNARLLVASLAACTLWLAGCDKPAAIARNEAPVGPSTAVEAPKPTATDPAPPTASEVDANPPFVYVPGSASGIRIDVVPAATRPIRAASPVVVHVEPIDGSVRRLTAPVGGTLGVPSTASWPEVAQRVMRHQALAAIVTSTDIPGRLRPVVSRRDPIQDGPRLLHLRSPIDGVIVAMRGRPGGIVKEGHEVMHVAPTERLQLAIAMSADDAAATPRDAQLVLRPDDGPVRVIPVAARADPLRTDRVAWHVHNVGDLLTPGQQLEGSLRLGPATDRLSIPASALIPEADHPAVFVRLPADRWQRRRLVIGDSDGEKVIVVGGLSPGEAVVTAGREAIRAAMFAARALR